MALPASTFGAGSFSYSDLPKDSPLSIVTAMPGVRNMLKYVALTPGETLVILAEHTADQTVLQAIAAGAAFLLAKVHVMHVAPFALGGWDNTTDLVGGLIKTADVLITLTYWGEVHCKHLFFDRIYQSKCRVLSLHQTATMSMFETGGRFPCDVYQQLEELAHAEWSTARETRVTSPDGTDLTWRDHVFTPSSRFVPGRGHWRPFPFGGVNWSGGSVNGVLVIVDSTATGVPAGPVHVTIKDGKVVDIKGDRAGVYDTRNFSPGGYYVRHALVGLNPKVRVAGGTQFEREKHAGAFYLGLDGLHDGVADLSQPGYAHNDVQIDRPNVWMDGVQIVEDGELLLLRREDVQNLAKAEDRSLLWNTNPRVILPDHVHLE